jgi:hypothetical protein
VAISCHTGVPKLTHLILCANITLLYKSLTNKVNLTGHFQLNSVLHHPTWSTNTWVVGDPNLVGGTIVHGFGVRYHHLNWAIKGFPFRYPWLLVNYHQP